MVSIPVTTLAETPIAHAPPAAVRVPAHVDGNEYSVNQNIEDVSVFVVQEFAIFAVWLEVNHCCYLVESGSVLACF